MGQASLWPKNSLPVPYPVVVQQSKEPDAPPVVEILVDDNFPKGRVYKYFPNQGYGIMKDRQGGEVCFILNEMDFVGPKRKESLKEGIPVGYDLVHVGKELRVKKMKIY